MSLQFPHALLSLKIASCLFIAIGLGWVFAEVRRFFFETGAFYAEAVDDQREGRTISLVCGVAYLLIGGVAAFDVFGFGSLGLSLQYPYVVGGPDAHRFLVAFCTGLVTWAILCAISTRLLPPPLFGEATTELLCNIVRGSLLVVWLAMLVLSAKHIGDHWTPDGIGLLIALLTLAAIVSGSLGNQHVFGWWEVPPITCEDRPFPYAASILLMMGGAWFCFVI